MKTGRKIDDDRYCIHENRSTRWIPPAVAVRMREFRPLQVPIRLQDLLNSARSRAEKKIKFITFHSGERIKKFRPLQEPIRLLDLLNSTRSRAEKKDNFSVTFHTLLVKNENRGKNQQQ